MKNTRMFVQLRAASTYFSVLDRFLQIVKKDKSERHPLFIPFIASAAATLECLLNEKLIQDANSKFGPDNARRCAEAWVSMPLRGKLDAIVPILSDSKFSIRLDSPTYQSLVRLISTRNVLMHNKSFFEEEDVQLREDEHGEKIMELAVSTRRLPHNLSLSDCTAYHRALVDLNDLLESPIAWEENHLIFSNL